ncbi:MAG: hypothetical protein ACRD2R_03060 [Terriglobales bacterium]
MVEPFLPGPGAPPAERDSQWPAIAAGSLLVVAALAAVVLLTRPSQAPAPAAPDQPHPYAAQVKFSDFKMAQVENFVGGKVTHLEGEVANTGQRTVTRITVEVVFRNTLGEVAQRETLPVMALVPRGPYVDVADLRSAPLAPGQSRGFRLTFEHVSAEWNREFPALTVVSVSFQ